MLCRRRALLLGVLHSASVKVLQMKTYKASLVPVINLKHFKDVAIVSYIRQPLIAKQNNCRRVEATLVQWKCT